MPAGTERAFQVIVANILAEMLANLLDGAYGNAPLAEPLAPGGHMILAGIIEEKAGMVVDAGERHGSDPRQHATRKSDWVALVMRRA